MKDIVAIDLETATSCRSSICEIGITEIISGVPQEPKNWLVQPPCNRYDDMNIFIHGITPADTMDSPSFPEVWKEVEPYLQNKTVVAHNTSFDMYALRDAFDYYNIVYPTFDYYCTLRIAKYIISGCCSYTLDSVLRHCGIELDQHHRAGSDSYGCAQLLLKCLEMDGHELDELEDIYNFHRGRFAPDVFIPHLKTNSSGTNRGGHYDYKEIIDGIAVDESKIDVGNYFYGKTVCFTGTCQFSARKDLLRKVAEVGGVPTNSVTTQTDVLVVGQQDFRVVGASGLSSKQQKAMKLQEKGHDIEVLSEVEFLSLI